MKLEKAFLALLLVAGSAAAQLVPVDKEVRINGNTPLAGETAVAMEPDGSFLVVWDNLQSAGSFSCIPTGVLYGRWFEADGTPRAPRFVIANDQGLCQIQVRLVRAENGGHLLTWRTLQGKYGTESLEGALLPASGHAVRIPSLALPDYKARRLQFPLSSGRFLVTTSRPSGLTGRLRSVSGAFLGPAFRMAGRDTIVLNATSLPGGGFAVAWQTTENGFLRVYVSRFDSAGRSAGALSRIDGPFGYGFGDWFQLAANDRGQLAAGWSFYPNTGGEVYSVEVRTFDTDGKRLAAAAIHQNDAVRVNSLAFGHGGRVVVAWEYYPGGDAYETDVRAALIDPDGQVIDTVDLTDHQEGRQIFPSVANTPDGRWVTVWSGEGDQRWAAYLRLFARE
jgi:hypothetical protein